MALIEFFRAMKRYGDDCYKDTPSNTRDLLWEAQSWLEWAEASADSDAIKVMIREAQRNVRTALFRLRDTATLHHDQTTES